MENTTVFSGRTGIIKASAKLVIKDFVEVMPGFKPGRSIESEIFLLGDTPFTIKVYPNGVHDENEGHVGIFLNNRGGDDDISVKCQLITDLETRNFNYTKLAKAGEFGWGMFLTHAQCAEAYKEKDFVVEAKLEMPGELTKIVGKQSASKKRKLNVLENAYNKMTGANFILVFEGVQVPCHKHILAAASPVLEAMVENKHKEAIEGKANIKLSADVGEAFVRFIYTGVVQEELLKENASAFLEMGELYDLQEMKDIAETELLSQLNKENMVQMVALGELYRAEVIFAAALKMTKVNMSWLRNQVYSI